MQRTAPNHSPIAVTAMQWPPLQTLVACAEREGAERRRAQALQRDLYAACAAGDMTATKAAIDAGAVLNDGANAPLHAACAGGHLELVEGLLWFLRQPANAAAHPDALGFDDQGRSPLLVALAGSHMAVCRALLDAVGIHLTTDNEVADWLFDGAYLPQ